MDDGVGLINMNARMYDAKLGRFLQPDTYIQFPESTQGFNRYTYVENNPLSYTDPTGNFHDGGNREPTIIERDEVESLAREIEREEGLESDRSDNNTGLSGIAESSKEDAFRLGGGAQETFANVMSDPNSPYSNRTPEVIEISFVGELSGRPFSNTDKIKIPARIAPENFKGGSVGGGAAKLGIRLFSRIISWLSRSRNARTALKGATALEAARAGNRFNNNDSTTDETGSQGNDTKAWGDNSTTKDGDGTQNKPPSRSEPIDETEWSGDHQDIKEGIGAGPADDTRISPDGDVWGRNPNGSWTNHGSAGDYTGSGKPSGRRGRDRRRRR